MKIVRALAQFVTSEVLLPATIVWFCVLIAAQFLPSAANNQNPAPEKRITPSGIAMTTTAMNIHTAAHEGRP
jgi:hypothetical protein